MVAIPFSYNLANYLALPVASAQGLIVLESDGLHLDSGGSYFYGLWGTSFYTDADVQSINYGLEPTPPQTLTTAQYSGLQLIAGEKLVIDYTYIPGDLHSNDFAFSLLKGPGGASVPILLSDVSNYTDTAHTHHVGTYTIGVTGSFDLLLGSADDKDTLEASTLIVHSISVQVPTGDYTLTGDGVTLTDGSRITPDGSYISPSGVPDASALSDSASLLVNKLDNLVDDSLISQDGNGLISQDGNGVISNDGGSLIGDDGSSLVGPDGSVLVPDNGAALAGTDGAGLPYEPGDGSLSDASSTEIAQDSTSLISQDGNGLISQDGNGLISQDGNGLIGQDGNGLSGNTYGVESLDESGGLTRQYSSTPPALPAGVTPPGTSITTSGPSLTGPAIPGTAVLVSPPANPATFLEQVTPELVALPDGQFVATWSSYDYTAGGGSVIEQQLLNADGTPAAAATDASGHSAAFAENESIAALAGGGYVIAWSNNTTTYTNAGEVTVSTVSGAQFDASGTYVGPAASPGTIPSDTTGNQDQVSLLALPDGSYLEFYRNSGASGANNTIRAQHWAADGTAIQYSFVVSAHLATTNAADPEGAVLSNGSGVVVYSDTGVNSATGVAPGIVAVIMAANGTVTRVDVAAGPEATERPVVAALANGNFVIAWIDDVSGLNGASANVVAQIFTANGSAVDTPFVVTTQTVPNVDPPAIAVLADGRFVISWTASISTGSNTNLQVFAQAYNPDGSLSFGEFSGSPGSYVSESALATLSDGTLEIAASDYTGASSEIHVEPVSFATTAPTTTTTPSPSPLIAGTEFAVSPAAASNVLDSVPSAAALSNGDFAVAWNVRQGFQQSIQVQVETPAGAMVASVVTIPPITATRLSASLAPTVVGLPNGQFAVVYQEAYVVPVNGGSRQVNIYAQLFGADATTLGSPTLLRATTGTEVNGLAAASLSDGSFITLTNDFDDDTGAASINAQRVIATGVTVGSAIPVGAALDSVIDPGTSVAVTGLPNNGFAAAFTVVGVGGVYVQVFDNFDYAPAPTLIAGGSAGTVTLPALTTLTNGDFVVAWNVANGTASTTVMAQVVDRTGTPVGALITGPTGAFNSNPPAITALADGRFVLAYDVQTAAGAATSATSLVQAQIYDADGTASGGVLAGNAANPAAFIASPAITQLVNGTVEIVAEHSGTVPGGSAIYDEPLTLASAPAPAAPLQEGRAVDGYIQGATVFADANDNGVLDPGEATATTDLLGRYNFTTPASGPVILTGGTDVSTGLPFAGTLEAPAGSLTVSPLTTLVQKIVATGVALVDAEADVDTALGFAADTDLTALDPVQSTLEGLAEGARSLVVSTTIQEVVTLATAAGATGDVYGALAAEIAADPAGFDPTSLPAIEGLGLGGSTASAIVSLGTAAFDLGIARITADAADPNALLLDIADIERTEIGTVAPDLGTSVAMQQDPGPLVAAYTGQNLMTASGVGAACFVTGTSIRLEHGEAPIESLRVGDMVLTARGAARAVIWTGHRRVACASHPRPHDVMPIHVAPNAFGEGQPCRDLWLSPDHAVFIDGVLIPIRYLLNGATIVQRSRPEVTYWHVELAGHDVILADGLPCESYLDTGNRSAFANGGPFVQMHPDFARRTRDARACARLCFDGAELEAARSHLRERAGQLGHLATDEPDLKLLVAGRTVAAALAGNRLRFDLPVQAGSAVLASRSAVPAHVRDLSNDHRLLGVAIGAMWLDGIRLDLADGRLGAGWHAPEGAADWRWTDGHASIDPTGARLLEVQVAIAARYWLEQPQLVVRERLTGT